ncbi:MAG: 4-hydroxy-tetrahydrodipicolinate synthase [Defluviitaleaceae bacterium]|nr:4-hydroxy-tetrahydrodipicolinate synthase [Defluviitaleaceae bacterium]
MEIFRGSGVAIVTPYKENGDVNYDVLEKLIEFQIKNHTDAIIICGTTGEASTLTDDEQIETIRFTAEKVSKRIPVVAGAGSNDTAHGKELCRRAYHAGADALLLATPYYNKTTQKGLIEHFGALAGAADIPVIVYNIPVRTGMSIAPQTMFELTKIGNIVGLKESQEIVHTMEIAALCGDRLAIYSGDDNNIVPILSLGGKGVISVLANVMPEATHDMVMSYLNGDTAKSLKIQLETFQLTKALFCEVNPIPVKAALNMMGFGVGGYRAPLTTMEPANEAFLRREMQKMRLI